MRALAAASTSPPFPAQFAAACTERRRRHYCVIRHTWTPLNEGDLAKCFPVLC
jgi:hypothetical protein